MDSLTQIALGAAVTEACIGKKVGNKALLWGAIAGTIPDLDVLANYFTDNISAIEIHRGLSHSIFFAILLALLLGWGLNKVYPKSTVSRKEWTIAMFLALFTHALLDAHTTWGTQIFWPFDIRLAYKNIFVIDPLYTLPLVLCLIWLFFKRANEPLRSKLNKIGLIVSTTYMALTLVFKGVAYHQFESSLERQGIAYTDIETRPSPLNSILWIANIKTEHGFRTGFYSLLDKQEEIDFSKEIPKQDTLLADVVHEEKIKILKAISKGWYTVEKQNDQLLFNDLRFGRMGMENEEAPFVFSFHLFYDANGSFQAFERPKTFNNSKQLLSDLILRLKGI